MRCIAKRGGCTSFTTAPPSSVHFLRLAMRASRFVPFPPHRRVFLCLKQIWALLKSVQQNACGNQCMPTGPAADSRGGSLDLSLLTVPLCGCPMRKRRHRMHSIIVRVGQSACEVPQSRGTFEYTLLEGDGFPRSGCSGMWDPRILQRGDARCSDGSNVVPRLRFDAVRP